MSRSPLAAEVAQRAFWRCEYCQMHQSLQGATFHVEHIIPESRGGPTEMANLAWACPGCNLRKASRVDVIDPQTGKVVNLFHPRRDQWSDHFAWDGYRTVPISPVGRGTVAALDLNDERRIRIRQAEASFDLFPPEEHTS